MRAAFINFCTSSAANRRQKSPAVVGSGIAWVVSLANTQELGDEITQCPRCGDALRVLAFITDPTVTAPTRLARRARSPANPAPARGSVSHHILAGGPAARGPVASTRGASPGRLRP